MLIPDLERIIEPTWKHDPGRAVTGEGWINTKSTTQATVPEDPKLLEMLGIAKTDKVLAIAGFYASWASKIAAKGVKVDYSDISDTMVDYVKKNVKVKFGKYICSNYELIPKKEKEYDWTFTFEACGGEQGLPIAYLRSLLNNKGGILALHHGSRERMGSKLRTYPNIVKTLAKTYGADFEVKELDIRALRDGEISSMPHILYILKTNDEARSMAKEDLKSLTTDKYSKDSLKRLGKVAALVKKEFLKDVK